MKLDRSIWVFSPYQYALASLPGAKEPVLSPLNFGTSFHKASDCICMSVSVFSVPCRWFLYPSCRYRTALIPFVKLCWLIVCLTTFLFFLKTVLTILCLFIYLFFVFLYGFWNQLSTYTEIPAGIWIGLALINLRRTDIFLNNDFSNP